MMRLGSSHGVRRGRSFLSRGAATAALALALAPGFAAAQGVPAVLEPWAEELDHVGMVSGLHAWTLEGRDLLVLEAPDGVGVIIGKAFGGGGQDLSAIHAQAAPIALEDMMNALTPPRKGASAAPGTDAPKAASEPTEAAPEGPMPPPADALPDEPRETEGDPAANAPTTTSAATTTGSAPPPSGSVVGQIAASGGDATVIAAEDPDEALDNMDWSGIEKETFWIMVGNHEAPGVYVLVDPTCPHCADSMNALKEQVEGGDLHLRVLLTPFMSEEAIRLSAGIMISDEPPVAYWRHEIEKALYGRNGVETAPLEKVGRKGAELLRRNVMWMREHGIPGVPFFLWKDEAGGWKTGFGVQKPEALGGALPLDLPSHAGMNLPADVLEGASPPDGSAEEVGRSSSEP